MPFKYLVHINRRMNTFTITPKQFEKINKSLSEALGIEYRHIDYESSIFEVDNVGRGGKTKGTTGYKYTQEQRKNISDSLKGKTNHWTGKTHSEETKQKISQSKKGSKWPEEGKEQRLEALKQRNKNRKFSEETIQRMREMALKREDLKRQNLGN